MKKFSVHVDNKSVRFAGRIFIINQTAYYMASFLASHLCAKRNPVSGTCTFGNFIIEIKNSLTVSNNSKPKIQNFKLKKNDTRQHR